MDHGNTRLRAQPATDETRLRPSGALEAEERAPRPKLSFGSWPIIEDRPRSVVGEQCEANR